MHSETLLHALGYAIFVRENSGALRISGAAPTWLTELWPQIADGSEALDSGVSPFLENFLIDAEECWRDGGEKRANSGPWIEQDASGASVQLEATALTADGQAVLLLERLGEAFEAKKSVLQKARETVIAHQRLNSEIQKKEILLHCVAEEMTATLANTITALRLLEMENLSPKSKMLLGLASRATDEQQALIHKVLAVFAAELNGTTASEADLFAVIERAVGSAQPQLAERKVRLTSAEETGETRVALAPEQLERLLATLLENAIEHLPRGGEIVLTVEDETDAALVKVEDDGATVSEDACASLFSKIESTADLSRAPELRLHFCRVLVESCRGDIGSDVRAGGGNCFWIRLPKVSR